MSYILCPICGQRNDTTGHTCWVQTIAPTAWNNHIDIRTDNSAVIRALEKRVEKLEQKLLGVQSEDFTHDVWPVHGSAHHISATLTETRKKLGAYELRIAEREAENQRLRDALTLVATCGLEPIDVAYRQLAERALLGGGE